MVQNKAQFDDRIRNLLALAEDNSVESRTLLFSHICDLFLQERPMESDNQIHMLIEIINELIADVDISIRKELSEILLSMDNPPEVLVKLISEDVAEVSGKLLEEAAIEDEQLLYLIKYASDDHRKHISRRFGLSPLLRRELNKAREQSHRAKEEVAEVAQQVESKKISLQDLEEAEQNSTVLNEDATANILQVLRAKKDRSTSTRTDVPAPEEEKKIVESSSPPLVADKVSLISRITKLEEKPDTDETESPAEEKTEEDGEKKDVAGPAEKKDRPEGKLGPIELESANDQNADEDEELILDHEAPQGGPTTVADEWFWEIDRYGNIKYLSENAEAVFLQSLDTLIGEDFLCLWRRRGASEADPNDFIALFEKRQPFRDEEFLFEISPNVFQAYSLSAIATFDIESGRFTGFRGGAHLNEGAIENGHSELVPEIEAQNDAPHEHEEKELILTSPIEADKDQENIENHRPQFSGSLVEGSDGKEVPHKNIEDEQDKVASELLHNLSHEFRTPLNAIIGFSQMIDNEMWGPVSEKYRKNTKNIINAANHLKEAVNNILDSAKMEAGLIEPSPESFSLKSVIQDAMDAVAPILESKEINVSGIDDNIDVILYNDKHCIILCLIKIITFATKHADVGDDLQLSVLVNSNAQVRIEIPILNQIIEEEKADELFQKTYDLNEKSDNDRDKTKKFETKIASGFGLSVAQDIAKLIGGKLSTMSANGRVSHIVFTISTYPI